MVGLYTVSNSKAYITWSFYFTHVASKLVMFRIKLIYSKNGIFRLARKAMQVVDEKQKINLEMKLQ